MANIQLCMWMGLDPSILHTTNTYNIIIWFTKNHKQQVLIVFLHLDSQDFVYLINQTHKIVISETLLVPSLTVSPIYFVFFCPLFPFIFHVKLRKVRGIFTRGGGGGGLKGLTRGLEKREAKNWFPDYEQTHWSNPWPRIWLTCPPQIPIYGDLSLSWKLLALLCSRFDFHPRANSHRRDSHPVFGGGGGAFEVFPFTAPITTW